MSESWTPRHQHPTSAVDGLSKAKHFEFFDERMKNYDVETSALHRKLQSKVEALRILRKELEQFRTERDQFKLMAETLQLRYSAIKRSNDYNNLGFGGKSSVAHLLHETRERNIKLTTEVESLKQKLSELQGDIELLRSKEFRAKERIAERTKQALNAVSKEDNLWKEERAKFISHLEDLKKKNAQLAFDLKAIIDEKEEIITERDAYKCKAHRLNHELFAALKANEAHPKFLDIDSIVLENTYLHERLKNYEIELEFTKQSMSKYKNMLDTKRKKGIIKLGSNANEETNILSHKQVKSILENGVDLPTKTETIADLKALCLALLDSLNDKNIALSHQKKTNKILATKIAELEHRIHVVAGTDLADSSGNSSGFSPSQMLLQGYCSAMVDSSANETNDTLTETARKSEDSETPPSAPIESPKAPHFISDDGLSSLSTESVRSIQSSEYGAELGVYSLSALTSSAFYAYKTPSTTTADSCNGGRRNFAECSSLPSSIVKERIEDLKDLPPDLAEMVQKALHELDMRDFDEVVGEAECIESDVLQNEDDTTLGAASRVQDENYEEEDDNH